MVSQPSQVEKDFDDATSESSLTSVMSNFSIRHRLRFNRSVMNAFGSVEGGREVTEKTTPASQAGENGQGKAVLNDPAVAESGIKNESTDPLQLSLDSQAAEKDTVGYPDQKVPRCAKCRLYGHTGAFCGRPWMRRRGTPRDAERASGFQEYLKTATEERNAVRESREKEDRRLTEDRALEDSRITAARQREDEARQSRRLADDRARQDNREREDRLAREREDSDRPIYRHLFQGNLRN